MSFILDALKKSESERHRHSGPVLMDVRIAPPRRRIPAWAWVIVAVLAVNLGVLAWLLWPGRHAQETASGASATALAAGQSAPSATMASPPAASPAGPTTQTVVPDGNPALATTVAPAAGIAAPAATAQVPAAGAGAPPAAAATPPPAAAAALPAPSLPVQPIDITTLPKVADMVAAGVVLPELRLSLHVYDPAPQNRYVLLNGARLREGDFTGEGVRVIQIMPTGVVVEWRSRRMFLGAGG